MSKLNLLVGTYTDQESIGIYTYQFNQNTGEIDYIDKTEVDNPSYMALSSDKEFLYVVSEQPHSKGKLSAYKRNRTDGKLTFLNEVEIDGVKPCYVSINKRRTLVVVANYGSGDIAVFHINTNGTLTEQVQKIEFQGRGTHNLKQDQPHVHCVKFSPSEDYLLVTDLGTDKIHLYKVLTSNKRSFLQPTDYSYSLTEDGSGPRHLIFHPNGKYIYVITELRGTLKVYDYSEQNETLTLAQTIKADALNGTGSADIHISPDGKFLYSSHRTVSDHLSTFSINPRTGLIKPLASIRTGNHPRHFTISPNGQFLLVACRDSNQVSVYRRDLQTGLLTPNQKKIKCSHPAFLKLI